jgi:hypothetical protein
MKRLHVLPAFLLALCAVGAQAAVVFNDGDFTNWSFGSTATNGGSATAVVEAAGGNPGARVNVTTVTPAPADTAGGTALKNDYSTTGILTGTPFTLTLDVLSGAGAFGDGQGIYLLVEQSGSLYVAGLGVTGVRASFTTLAFPGTFSAASFTRISGAGPATPNLGGGTVTRFGFVAANTGSSTLTQYYDNVRLDIAPVVVPPPASQPTGIPTLSEWSLIGLALLLALVAYGRLGRTRQ